VLGLVFTRLQAQEFNRDEQYKQALANAKTAFEAKQYSEAVLFYREALIIKPEARLPIYKIEDIRTIYIEKELGTLMAKQKGAEKKKHRKKKEEEVQQTLLAEQAKVNANKKLNNDVAEVQKQREELKLNLPVQAITVNDQLETDSLIVESVQPDRVTGLDNLEVIQQKPIDSTNEPKGNIKLTVQKREEIKQPAESDLDSVPVKVEPEKKPVIKQTPVQKEQAVILVSPEKKKEWIEQEQKRLATIYPDQKTVEDIDKPGKHITRVIMNINNRVTVYLKVKHDWGATFFFIDEVGNGMQSVNEQYFNLMTNLKTYGN